MNENPYQSPVEQKPVTGAQAIMGLRTGSIEELRKVASNQRGVLTCILLQLFIIGAQFVLRVAAGGEPDAFLQLVFSLALITVGIISAIYIFRLAIRLYPPAVGIAMGILTLIPCIGLLVLMVLNGKATSVLRLNGIRVGLLGADPATI